MEPADIYTFKVFYCCCDASITAALWPPTAVAAPRKANGSLSGHWGVEWSRFLALCPESNGWGRGGASAVLPGLSAGLLKPWTTLSVWVYSSFHSRSKNMHNSLWVNVWCVGLTGHLCISVSHPVNAGIDSTQTWIICPISSKFVDGWNFLWYSNIIFDDV